MPNESKILVNIERLGNKYCTRHLNMNKEELENDWWAALRFFLSHSFPRGRKDELSNEYYYFTVQILKECSSIGSESLDKSYKRLMENEQLFNKTLILEFKNSIKRSGTKGSIIKHLDFEREVASKNLLVKILSTPKKVEIHWDEEKTYHKEVHLGNEEDIMMVLDVLKFISDESKKNIYKYLKNTIYNSGAKRAYKELGEIRAVGDKIASLIIRDIGLLNPEIIKAKDYEYAFPIDTWVNKISTKLGVKGNSIQDIKQTFIKACIGSSISPLKVAAGLWYLGSNSLDLALEYLDEVEIDAKRQGS